MKHKDWGCRKGLIRKGKNSNPWEFEVRWRTWVTRKNIGKLLKNICIPGKSRRIILKSHTVNKIAITYIQFIKLNKRRKGFLQRRTSLIHCLIWWKTVSTCYWTWRFWWLSIKFLLIIDEVVEKRTDSPREGLDRLLKCTNGNVKYMVKHCIQEPPTMSYCQNAKNTLVEKYRNLYRGIVEYRKRLRLGQW